MTAQPATSVILEIGRKRVFASAVDWPGWCRSGRGEEQALEALAAYLPRYAPVAQRCGLELPPAAADAFAIVERLPGSGVTDFGAPDKIAACDFDPLTGDDARRIAALTRAAWAALGDAAASAPARLRKGPRGGGRDRDQIIEHVIRAEASYARKIGVRQRTPASGDTVAVTALRAAIAEVLGQARGAAAPQPGRWPARYAARRIAWHALDHAWEIADKSDA